MASAAVISTSVPALSASSSSVPSFPKPSFGVVHQEIKLHEGLGSPVAPARQMLASKASWYGPGFYGRRTANGEIYTGKSLTAAHKTLPFGTRVKVTNLRNGRSVVVRVNDDGPHIPGRVIDLSHAAASRIGLIQMGVAPVKLEVLN